MVSDGVIAEEEIAVVKSICQNNEHLKDLDYGEIIKKFSEEVKKQGKKYIQGVLQEIQNQNFTQQEQLDLIEVAIMMIKADEQIEYSEVKFFKTIRYRLSIDDETVIDKLSPKIDDVELFLGQDIKSIEQITNEYFNEHIDYSNLISDIKTQEK
ncbi:MAG: TerB family tellurite resistance protein [Bacteroidales bacterium]|jgi:uncharacterized tellurite resistance protein B-like protein|nr:TerB family tellurite resistance protein [Bacteroidales bacterium]